MIFVAPLLRRMQGEPFAPPGTSEVVLAADAPNPGERTTYATAQFTDGGVELTGKQGSHMTKALADADGFAILPWDRDVVAAGETRGVPAAARLA